MNVLNWNIRGLNAYRKKKILIDVLRDNKIDIVAIQETKKDTFSNRFLRSYSSHIDLWHWIPSIGRSGGVLFGYTSSKFDIIDVQLKIHSLTIILHDKQQQIDWMFTTAYAPIDRSLKQLSGLNCLLVGLLALFLG